MKGLKILSYMQVALHSMVYVATVADPGFKKGGSTLYTNA